MRRVNFLLPAIFLLSTLWPGLSGAESEPAPVTVLASQVLRQDGTAQYLYKVTNKSAHPIVAIAIGADYYHGTSELNTYPLGWTADSTIPEGNTMSPPGWSPTVITTEESPYVEIEWRNDGRADTQPGQVNAGFGVIVAHPNPQYLNAHWTAIFSDATAASGQLLANGVPRLVAKLASATQIAPGRWQLSRNSPLLRAARLPRPNSAPFTHGSPLSLSAFPVIAPNSTVTETFIMDAGQHPSVRAR